MRHPNTLHLAILTAMTALGAASLQPAAAQGTESASATRSGNAASAQSGAGTYGQAGQQSGTQSSGANDAHSSGAGDAQSGSTDGMQTRDRSSAGSASTRTAESTRKADGSGGARASSSSSGDGVDTLWILMPVALQSRSDQASNGCWVRLYSGDNFEGRYVTIMGPSDVPSLRSPYGTGMNNWESAVVGPNATVTTYDDQNFRARDAVLRAGQRYAELDDSKLGLFEDIESMRVRCANSGDASRSSGSSGAANTSGSTG